MKVEPFKPHQFTNYVNLNQLPELEESVRSGRLYVTRLSYSVASTHILPLI